VQHFARASQRFKDITPDVTPGLAILDRIAAEHCGLQTTGGWLRPNPMAG
jgi:hypothetical protein